MGTTRNGECDRCVREKSERIAYACVCGAAVNWDRVWRVSDEIERVENALARRVDAENLTSERMGNYSMEGDQCLRKLFWNGGVLMCSVNGIYVCVPELGIYVYTTYTYVCVYLLGILRECCSTFPLGVLNWFIRTRSAPAILNTCSRASAHDSHMRTSGPNSGSVILLGRISFVFRKSYARAHH